MTAGSDLQDFDRIFAEFLECRNWSDEIEVDPDTRGRTIVTGVSIQQQQGMLIVEGKNDTAVLGIFLYLKITCRENKLKQMAQLFNWINPRILVGAFECLDDGRMRWKFTLDCENSDIHGSSVSINLQHGWNSFDEFLEPILAVALTKTSCEEAVADHLTPGSDEINDEDDIPDEL